MANYVYPAIFKKEGTGYSSSFNLIAFSDDWVDIVGLDNEKFPPLIDIMRNAEKYIDNNLNT